MGAKDIERRMHPALRRTGRIGPVGSNIDERTQERDYRSRFHLVSAAN